MKLKGKKNMRENGCEISVRGLAALLALLSLLCGFAPGGRGAEASQLNRDKIMPTKTKAEDKSIVPMMQSKFFKGSCIQWLFVVVN